MTKLDVTRTNGEYLVLTVLQCGMANSDVYADGVECETDIADDYNAEMTV